MSARRDPNSQQERDFQRSPHNRLSEENPLQRSTNSTSRRSHSQILVGPYHDQSSPRALMGFDYPRGSPLERMSPLRRPEDLRGSPEPFVQQQPLPPAPFQQVHVPAVLNQPVNVQVDIDHSVIHRRGAEPPVAGQGALDPQVPDRRIFVRQLSGALLERGRSLPRSRIPLAPPMNLIPIGRLRFEFTVNAERIVYFILSLATNTFSVVTGAVFWVATVSFIWTCFTSQVPSRVFNELIQRHIAGYPANGSIWGYMFPAIESNNAHQLRLTVHAPGYPHPTMIYSTSIPILIHNPVFWLILMVCTCTGHHLLCFAHECLRNAHERLEQQTET